MPGVELSGERRLLALWLILCLLFGLVYYLGAFGRNPFVQRFERAYYTVFWSRPFLSTEKEGLQVGVIAPQYVSSLIDSEMWVWVRNTSTVATPQKPSEGQVQETPNAEPVKNTAVLSPLIIVEYTSKIARQATSAPGSTEAPPTLTPQSQTQATEASPTPTSQSQIQAQVLLREGDSQTNYYTESRSGIVFSDIYPGETAARLVWVRLMPQAYRQGKGDPSESIYLSEREITGTIQFDYVLWESPAKKTSHLDFEGLPPEATINTRQAVMRGFARTLLLPPWSNGLLIGLGLISAFMINLLVSLVEMRLTEGSEIEREERRNRSSTGRYEPSPNHKTAWFWQPIFWLCQGAFWVFAIASVFLLVARLTETLILCPMAEVARPSRPVEDMPALGADLPSGYHPPLLDPLTTTPETQCVEWPLWPCFFITSILATALFYFGYLWKSIPFNSIGPTLLAIFGRPPPPPSDVAEATTIQSALSQIADMIGKLVKSVNIFATASPVSQESTIPAGDSAVRESDGDNQSNHSLTPEESAREQARKRANDLTEKISDLHAGLMGENIDSPEAIKPHVDEYRNRYTGLVAMVSDLPPAANWKRRKKGPRLLNEIDLVLDQLEGYLSLVEPVKELSDKIREGDPAGLDRLMEIRNHLSDVSRPFNIEPAKTLAEKTVAQIEETGRYYREHFIELHTNINNDASLVEVLDKLETLRSKEGSGVYVRFFSDGREDKSKIMYLSEAKDITIGRLSRYRNGLVTEKNDYIRNILSSVESGNTNKEDALSDLISLRNETNDWPGSLPGYEKYPERGDGEDDFPQLVEDLKRNISDAINVLMTELVDQTIPPPGHIGSAAPTDNE